MIKKPLNDRIINWIENVVEESVIAKWIVGFGIWIIALIPTWLYLFIRCLINPETFWQEFALFVIATIVIGWLQVILIITGLLVTVAIALTDEF